MENLPVTQEQALDVILSWLSEEDKQYVRSRKKHELFDLHFGLGLRIRNELLYGGNPALIDALKGERWYFSPDELSAELVEAVWRRLQHSTPVDSGEDTVLDPG